MAYFLYCLFPCNLLGNNIETIPSSRTKFNSRTESRNKHARFDTEARESIAIDDHIKIVVETKGKQVS